MKRGSNEGRPYQKGDLQLIRVKVSIAFVQPRSMAVMPVWVISTTP